MASRLVVVAVLLGAVPASADDVIPGHEIDRRVEGAVISGAVGLALRLSLIPIRRDRMMWQRELFGSVDASVHARFSPRAARISDATLVALVATPAVSILAGTIDDADGDRLMLYTEALVVNLALFQGAKRLVQRPRPYLYSTLPGVAEYAVAEGDDAYQSFYSAHAATAFCAATAGGYLAGTASSERWARRLAWSSGFAAAAWVANLRVRAGKHFYSDVAVGALVGIAIGYGVPAFHADAGPYVPDLADLGAAMAGLLGGGLLSQLLPLDPTSASDASRVPVRPRWSRALRSLHVGPVAMPSGTGVGIAGAM